MTVILEANMIARQDTFHLTIGVGITFVFAFEDLQNSEFHVLICITDIYSPSIKFSILLP